MDMQDLTGKVAVVTGASSGIGAATARLLAKEGVSVILVARRKDRIDAIAAELGETALAIATDVADLAAVQAMMAEVKARFGGIDLLFNNAGMGINGPFADSDPADWKTQIDANLYGVLNCTHAALPLLKGRAGAMVSIVSSVGGRYGIAGWSVYNAAKFAVVGFADALRKEVGEHGIRVSLIEPGSVWTEWGHNVPEETMRTRRESLDALQADDIAQALVYAFAQPPRVLVEEILVRPVRQITP